MRITTLLIACLLFVSSCSSPDDPVTPPTTYSGLVTFLEIGSVNCIPCVEMQPIMKSLASRYGATQLDVRFIDVFKDPIGAEPFKIRVMPTQVFLDKSGVEFHRHEGFYPEASIDSLLQARGLKPL